MSRTCANCKHWETDAPDTAVAAPCALRIIARPEFWQGCTDFLDRERAAAEQMTLQSQARGTAIAYWGTYMSEVKQ